MIGEHSIYLKFIRAFSLEESFQYHGSSVRDPGRIHDQAALGGFQHDLSRVEYIRSLFVVGHLHSRDRICQCLSRRAPSLDDSEVEACSQHVRALSAALPTMFQARQAVLAFCQHVDQISSRRLARTCRINGSNRWVALDENGGEGRYGATKARIDYVTKNT